MAQLPVLMYHNFTSNQHESKGLTISISKFERQLKYIVDNQFTTYFISDLVNKTSINDKSLIITFDDVTENQLVYALPLLIKYKIKATFFIPFSYIGKTDLWNDGTEKIMTIEQLKSLDKNYVQLAHHSYFHRKYSTLSDDEIQEDFDESFKIINDNKLDVFPALAYPYGNFPKKGIQKLDFFKILEKNNIQFAFRIGNRLNKFPFKNKFEINRIDVKGHQSMLRFILKLKFGKIKLF